MIFFEKLSAASIQNHSFLCVGLDPVREKIPSVFNTSAQPIFDFNKAIIDATWEHVCAYKPNSAFYEQYGLEGLDALKKTIEYIPKSIPIILDVKRSDIGSTAQAYAKAAFDAFGADAVTLNPLLGYDSVAPFLEYRDKGVFILALTSNPGAEDFQKRSLEGRPLYERVIETVTQWDTNHQCGFVAGATQQELSAIRTLAPNAWFLIPGVGSQGGDVDSVVSMAVVDPTHPRIVINASRSILYASDTSSFFHASAREALILKEKINFSLERKNAF